MSDINKMGGKALGCSECEVLLLCSDTRISWLPIKSCSFRLKVKNVAVKQRKH